MLVELERLNVFTVPALLPRIRFFSFLVCLIFAGSVFGFAPDAVAQKPSATVLVFESGQNPTKDCEGVIVNSGWVVAPACAKDFLTPAVLVGFEAQTIYDAFKLDHGEGHLMTYPIQHNGIYSFFHLSQEIVLLQLEYPIGQGQYDGPNPWAKPDGLAAVTWAPLNNYIQQIEAIIGGQVEDSSNMGTCDDPSKDPNLCADSFVLTKDYANADSVKNELDFLLDIEATEDGYCGVWGMYSSPAFKLNFHAQSKPGQTHGYFLWIDVVNDDGSTTMIGAPIYLNDYLGMLQAFTFQLPEHAHYVYNFAAWNPNTKEVTVLGSFELAAGSCALGAIGTYMGPGDTVYPPMSNPLCTYSGMSAKGGVYGQFCSEVVKQAIGVQVCETGWLHGTKAMELSGWGVTAVLAGALYESETNLMKQWVVNNNLSGYPKDTCSDWVAAEGNPFLGQAFKIANKVYDPASVLCNMGSSFIPAGSDANDLCLDAASTVTLKRLAAKEHAVYP